MSNDPHDLQQFVSYCVSTFNLPRDRVIFDLFAIPDETSFFIAQAERNGAKATLKVTKNSIGFTFSYDFVDRKFGIFTSEDGGITQNFERARDEYYHYVRKHRLTPVALRWPI